MKKIILLCIMFIMLFTGVQISSAYEETATIHGAIYEWDSFEPMERVIVEVNSTPPQSMLATYGIYSFNLTPGDYTLTATYYEGSDLVAYTEEKITITDHGDYLMDLILMPVYYEASFNESEFAELDDIASFSDEDKSTTSTYSLMIILFFIVVLIAGAYIYLRGRNSSSSNDDDGYDEDSPEPLLPDDKWQDLPDELRQVVAIIAKNDGRITQKDLRTKVKHSEAKVSLMVSDLESRGIVRKFKKGRGNIIILEDSVNPDQNT